ncbi:MAG: hypothetical protein M3Y27_00315, partial [Acidobacteriota bacterium]|nr:hypothetical protein [Acidobacteriota bacterium]
HDLGVFLHFQDDDLLARTVLLQNQWATAAVFQILDDETVRPGSAASTVPIVSGSGETPCMPICIPSCWR